MTDDLTIPWLDDEDEGASDLVFAPLPFVKSVVREDGGRRLLFCEASNDNVDLEREQLMQKALHESADYFLKKGNIDIDHLTITGIRLGIPNPRMYEIGRPTEVLPSCGGRCTLVKGLLYRGDGTTVADWFWKTLTAQDPPMPWFASVAGGKLAESTVWDPRANLRKAVVNRVLWSNLAMASEPVNETVGAATTTPFGAFAKSQFAACKYAELGGATTSSEAVRVLSKSCGPCADAKAKTCPCDDCRRRRERARGAMLKGLTAGYGTDSAALEGGAALRTESLHGAPKRGEPFKWKGHARRFVQDLMKGAGPDRITVDTVSEHMQKNYGLSPEHAGAAAHRLVKRIVKRKSARAAA